MTLLRMPIKDSLLAAAAIGCFALSFFSAENASAMSVDQALEATYEFNPVLKSEREALAAIDERVAQAISEWRPTVTADYSKGRQRSIFGNSREQYTDKETQQLAVEQPLFNGGGSVARYRSSKLQVEAGRARLMASTQEVLLQGITAYMDVVRDKAVMELSKNNVGVLNKQLDASQDRFDVGEVTRTDVAQSKARLARAVSDEAQADGSTIASNAIFKRVVGVDPTGLEPPTMMPEVPATLTDAIAIALESNPTLKRAIYTEQSLDKEISVNKARILPSVSLLGSMRREEGAGVTGGSDYDNDLVTVNVSVPLYQSGAEYSRIREAKQNFQKSKFDSLDARNGTVESVVRAWQSLETSRATIQANKSAIEAAQTALDGVKQEQQYGARTVLDVLDAEQELFTARVNLVRSQRNEVVAAYTLLAAMGQLTPQRLGLKVKLYNPEENYDRVKFRPIGF